MITSQLYEWMYACPLQGYRTLSPRLSANIGRSDSYRLSGIILNCTTTVFLLFHFCISKDRSLWLVALIGLLWHPAVFLSLSLLVYLAVINARNVKFLGKFWYFPEYIWRSVRSCSQTIPEKVRNSRPINMGFKGWEWLPGWSSRTFKPFRYKKFNEWAQTANSSVFSRLHQELCAENPQNMEYKGNWNVNYSKIWTSTNYPG